MVTLYCAAAFSAPCRTACQNWCWKPFEIIGMNALVPGADDEPLPAGVPPQAAATMTTAAIPPNKRIDLPLPHSSPSPYPPPPLTFPPPPPPTPPPPTPPPPH